MPTQTSQLVSNLQTIYNTKLQIKAAIGTNSDDFTEYPDLIEEAISEGGGGSGEVVDPYSAPTAGELIANGEDLTQTFPYLNANISDNFSYTSSIGEPTSIEWDDFYTYTEDNTQVELTIHHVVSNANCPADEIYQSFEDYPDLYGNVFPCLTNCTITESEDPSEDGYDYLVEAETNYMFNQNDMLNPVEEITENGFYASGGYNALGFNVNVSGGSGSSADPWYDFVQLYEMIENGETSANYVRSTIAENFEYTEENNEYTISWDDIEEIETGEVDQNNEPILEEKKIHVVLTGDPHEIYVEGSDIASSLEDYHDLYEQIHPILENATLTASEDPSNDGYDYLLEGDLYAWNMRDCSAPVQEITENGFYLSDGEAGFDVNVEPSIERSNNYHIFDLRNTAWPMVGAAVTEDTSNIQNYNQLIYHSGVSANYVDPVTNEESTNSYYNFEITGANRAAISGLSSMDVFNDSTSDIQQFEYNGQSNAYVDNVDIYQDSYSEDIDPDTGDPIPNWEHSNVALWGAVQGQHLFELEPGDVIYVTSYTVTVNSDPTPIVYRNGAAIWNNYADLAMWPYEKE